MVEFACFLYNEHIFSFKKYARELNARIYFCIEAAKKGHKPYFGQKIDLEPLVRKLKIFLS